MKIRIWYCPIDNGDGSVSVHFFKSKEDADRAAKIDFENSGQGWGEDCVSFQDIKIDADGNYLNPDEMLELWE